MTWAPSVVRELPNGHWYDRHREGRVGVMLHYDASVSDAGAMSWFEHPQCRVSYHYLVLDDGSYATIAPLEAAPWHAGRCRSSNPTLLPYSSANHAFYAIAAATNDRVDVTPLQLATIAWLCRRLFARERWPILESWRIVGHSSEAVNPDGSRGRKQDPEGGDPGNPIFSPADVRQLLGRVQL